MRQDGDPLAVVSIRGRNSNFSRGFVERTVWLHRRCISLVNTHLRHHGENVSAVIE